MTDIIDRTRIEYAHWQMKLAYRGRSGMGLIAAGLDDLEQAIHTIAMTEKGSVPLAPEKCVRILEWIDRPPDVAIPNIARELWDGITTFEPRIIVEKVTPLPQSDSHWRFPVFWYPRADVTRQIRLTEVRYGQA